MTSVGSSHNLLNTQTSLWTKKSDGVSFFSGFKSSSDYKNAPRELFFKGNVIRKGVIDRFDFLMCQLLQPQKKIAAQQELESLIYRLREICSDYSAVISQMEASFQAIVSVPSNAQVVHCVVDMSPVPEPEDPPFQLHTEIPAATIHRHTSFTITLETRKFTFGRRLNMVEGTFGQLYKATYVEEGVIKRALVKQLDLGGSTTPDGVLAEYNCQGLAGDCISPKVLGLGHARERVYLAMEMIEGSDAFTEGCLGDRFVPIANQLLDHFRDLHARGIIHHDIKPENIMITPENQVKIIDYGMARKKRTDISSEEVPCSRPEGTRFGTPGYLPSRVSDHGVLASEAESNDYYALGVVFLYLYTGRDATARYPEVLRYETTDDYNRKTHQENLDLVDELPDNIVKDVIWTLMDGRMPDNISVVL